MLKSKKIKKLSIITIIPLFCLLIMLMNPKIVHADITNNGSTYHVSNGNDLWNLLSDSDNYWSGNSSWLNPKPPHTPQSDITIIVDAPITLPNSNPNLYSGLKNVKVDFQNQPFYVDSTTSSSINVNSNYQANQLTVSNVNIQTQNGSNNNKAFGVKKPDGSSFSLIDQILGNNFEYYTTSNGLLFSSNTNNGPASNTPVIIYNNVNYNCPGDLTSNQPLTTNAIPVEFQGNNNLVTGTTANQLAQIPNIKVTSGTTTMTGNGINAFSYGLINPTNNQSFPIEITNGSTLNINNNSSRSQMFNFNHSNNPIQINNSGSLNLNNNGNSDVFSKGVTGVDLTNTGQTNLTATSSIFNSASMGTARVNMDLASGSQTLLASKNNAPFSNQSPWGSGSLIKFHPNAKFLSYSGMTYSAGGLTNNKSSDIPVEFIDTGSGSNGYKTNQFPSNVDSYNDLNPISSKFNPANTVISSSDLTNFDANALTLSGQLAFSDTSTKNYNWEYSLDKLPVQAGFLPRTSGDNLNFNVIDSLANNAKFKINATYTTNQSNQPFTMWFVNQKQQTQLNQNSQTVLTSDQMDKNGANYQKAFTNDQGLVIKADNKAKSGQYSGVVDWTLLNGI